MTNNTNMSDRLPWPLVGEHDAPRIAVEDAAYKAGEGNR